MSSKGQLLWNATPQNFDGKPEVEFSYSPGLGLADADFHPVAARDWHAMKSPSPDAVATLEVPADLTLAQLQPALELISSKGSYRTIEIVVRR
jgi:hypothetical protein